MKKLEVRFRQQPDQEIVVGTLALARHRTYFEYDPLFLQTPLWLSPFKLPPSPGLIEHRDRDFGPLFGLFDDSLPDGWGVVLMDRFFQQQRELRSIKEISVLDRLAFLGTRTMGALTYHPPSDPSGREARELDLHEMARASKEVIEGTSREILHRLVRAGGSPGGARPKVLIGLRGEKILSGEDDLPPGYSHWIVKFRAREDPLDAGPLELAYSVMARSAGITMPATQLFETAAGERFFGIERFDRREGRRLHVHTFGNLIHADFRIPSCDYHQLLEVTRILTKNHRDSLEMFRRMVFNIAAHNRDDHVKNFSFRLSAANSWELAPAYDLVFSAGPRGEHSMTVAGEGQAPSRRNILEIADEAGIGRGEASRIIDQVVSAVAQWRRHAQEVGVGIELTKEVDRAIGRCLARL